MAQMLSCIVLLLCNFFASASLRGVIRDQETVPWKESPSAKLIISDDDLLGGSDVIVQPHQHSMAAVMGARNTRTAEVTMANYDHSRWHSWQSQASMAQSW
eukprot:gnl/MRDRNA2_/MRDRNA2_90997_c0_seq1.p1 gnl/MRDRNA2_/MRDRNA2_90997_c0~~gnl/MRDRNA2_/MRDRNA2_90997_c0_seq1.p1  ORF type:complete len:118 (-),score=9.94 gnl/MRDRNA2_/MRDRNA2_90997_c0_seq1:21-323(-)